jgi:hypothetical protein
MQSTEPNNTCDIYRRRISELRDRGDVNALAEMVETWYSRCDFASGFDGELIVDLGVTDRGVVWIETPRGTIEFCPDRLRWRLVEPPSDATQSAKCHYVMARIAEVAQVPFAYLCGVRDAVAVIERVQKRGLSDEVRRLTAEQRKITKDIRAKRIALDAVVVSLDQAGSLERVNSKNYPDAPAGTLSWEELRQHFRDCPGVYFAWESGRIVYVGVTEKGMHSRLQSGHHAVTSRDRFSFIEMPCNEVYFAENVYISRYAPERNACVAQALGLRKGGHRGRRREPASAKRSAAVSVGSGNS